MPRDTYRDQLRPESEVPDPLPRAREYRSADTAILEARDARRIAESAARTMHSKVDDIKEDIAAVKAEVAAVKAEVASVKSIVSGTTVKILIGLGTAASAMIGGGYYAAHDVTKTSRQQAAAVATVVAQQDVDARLALLLKRAIQEARREERLRLQHEPAANESGHP